MFVHASSEKSNSSPFINRKKQQPFFSPGLIQRKLTIGPVDDEYEREADAVADKVMRMSSTETLQTKPSAINIQRKCKHCEEEEKLQRKEDDEDNQILFRKPVPDLPLQRKCAACQKEEENIHLKKSTGSSVPGVSPSVYDVLQSSGHSLDMGTRSFMESRFGYDFSNVQIHIDSIANQSSADINALAYTYGKHIVFGRGQYQPNTKSGKQLLAHELTHVVQQNPDTIKRQPVPNAQKDMSRADEIKLSITSPGDFDVSANPFTISVFNFGIDKSDLKPEHKKVLDEIAFLLKIIPQDKFAVLIEGNADSTGTREINDPLSRNRSNAVKKYLKNISGESFFAIGFGADLPISTNETISGRDRNRRVDILFFPKIVIKRPECEHPPCLPQCEHPPCNEKSFCERHSWVPILCGKIPCLQDPGIIESIICISILCMFTPLSAFCKCVLNPSECFCLMFPEKCLPRPKKGKPRACPIDVELPTGDLPMAREWPWLFLLHPFDMKLEFTEPQDDCRCNCGEYKQIVRGFFEREYMDGRVERSTDPRFRKWLTPGVFLEPNTFHEDGDGTADSEYGFRSHPSRNGTYAPHNPTRVIDLFEPTQSDGCKYRGQDNPGFSDTITQPDTRRKTLFLEFEGGPVDKCILPGVRTPLSSYWHTWTVQGEIINPAAGPGTGPGKGPGGPTPMGKVKAIRARPRIINHKGSQPVTSVYEGGLPIDATPKSVHNITFSFNVDGSPDPYYYTVEVLVLENNTDSIKFVTTNNNSLNLAPPGKPEIILNAHKVVTIPKSYLK